MIDLREPKYPKFQWGESVVAATDLYNDGSVPDAPEDVLLVVAGGPGEIVQVGHHQEGNLPVYMVDFGVAVIGCLEEEITREAEGA
jgi:nitrogen fixation protein NifZ